MEPSGQPPLVSEDKASEVYGIRRLDGSPYPAQDLPLRRALLRDSQGRPSTPLGAALDIISEGER